MKIITAGRSYVDIDAYACAVAYAELLSLQGISAMAVCTAPLNESITKTIQSWQAPLSQSYTPSDEDEFVIVDVSEPEQFDRIVNLMDVTEVIDHHVGHEAYWKARIGDKADIEFIGAACTQIYERYQKAGLLMRMSSRSAKLLICGILDNTLNFGAKITTQRDVDAYTELLKVADLPDNWTDTYFSECESEILANPGVAIANDTKIVPFKTYGSEVTFGQLAVWNADELLESKQAMLVAAMQAKSSTWMINLISIGDGKSYFISSNPDVQTWLSDLLGITFNGTVAAADRLWLRKEVIKQDLER